MQPEHRAEHPVASTLLARIESALQRAPIMCASPATWVAEEGEPAMDALRELQTIVEREEAVVSDGSIEIQVVGAIRLALEGAADDETLLRLVQWLVEQAPDTSPSDTASVRLFIEGIRGIGGSVSTASPSGAYVSA